MNKLLFCKFRFGLWQLTYHLQSYRENREDALLIKIHISVILPLSLSPHS